MELFNPGGHLTDEALRASAEGQELPELSRLEIAEHLAYCDRCLQRYTELLDQAPLLCPARSCKESLWRQVRKRTIRLLTSRYATAAARGRAGADRALGRRFAAGRGAAALTGGRNSRFPASAQVAAAVEPIHRQRPFPV